MHEVSWFLMRFDYDSLCGSVSEDLLCAFELLKPLDPAVIKKELSKAKRKRCVPFFDNPSRHDPDGLRETVNKHNRL
jgi:hypothetical protein